MKRTYTFVPCTLHTLQHVYRVRTERVRAFLQGRRGRGGMQPEPGSTRTGHDQADSGGDHADGE